MTIMRLMPGKSGWRVLAARAEGQGGGDGATISLLHEVLPTSSYPMPPICDLR